MGGFGRKQEEYIPQQSVHAAKLTAPLPKFEIYLETA